MVLMEDKLGGWEWEGQVSGLTYGAHLFLPFELGTTSYLQNSFLLFLNTKMNRVL